MSAPLQITKLQKRKGRLRMAIVGPTGSGKTYTSMLFMRYLLDPADRILIIDTEHESAGLYADDLNSDDRFDTINPPDHSPETYVKCLELARKNGYKGVVIDSLSHAWMGKQGALEQVDNIAKRSQSKSSFNAWREVTPMHGRLVEALLSFPGHLIVTMRVKTEYVVETDERGKSAPRKIGLSPVQRDGVEYEFDIVADMDQSQNFIVSKTRMSALKGIVVHEPGETVAQGIRDWLEGGKMDARMIMEELDLDEEAKKSLAALAKTKGVKGGALALFIEGRWAEGSRSLGDLMTALRAMPDAEDEEGGSAKPAAIAPDPAPVTGQEAATPPAEAAPASEGTAEPKAEEPAQAEPPKGKKAKPEKATEPSPIEYLTALIGEDVVALWTKALKAANGEIEAVAYECQDQAVTDATVAKQIYQRHRREAADRIEKEIDEAEKAGAAS